MSSKHQILEDLAKRIQRIESRQRHSRPGGMATGIAAMDTLLPDGGLACGSLMELLATAHGSGAWTLGVLMAAHVCQQRKTLVIIDAAKQLYFPGAVRLGLKLHRAIVVRPDNRQDAHQAIVQSLRSRAVGAVICWQDGIGMRQLRRLQVAAERGGTLAVLLRSKRALRGPSCAAVRWLVSPVASHGIAPYGPREAKWSTSESQRYLDRPSTRRVRVEVVRCRGRAPGQSLVLEIDDETGHVHAPAPLAPAAAMARSARASG